MQQANTRQSLYLPSQGIHTEQAVTRHETRWPKQVGNITENKFPQDTTQEGKSTFKAETSNMTLLKTFNSWQLCQKLVIYEYAWKMRYATADFVKNHATLWLYYVGIHTTL